MRIIRNVYLLGKIIRKMAFTWWYLTIVIFFLCITGFFNLVDIVVTFSACTVKVILSNLIFVYLLFLRQACRSLNNHVVLLAGKT